MGVLEVVCFFELELGVVVDSDIVRFHPQALHWTLSFLGSVGLFRAKMAQLVTARGQIWLNQQLFTTSTFVLVLDLKFVLFCQVLDV